VPGVVPCRSQCANQRRQKRTLDSKRRTGGAFSAWPQQAHEGRIAELLTGRMVVMSIITCPMALARSSADLSDSQHRALENEHHTPALGQASPDGHVPTRPAPEVLGCSNLSSRPPGQPHARAHALAPSAAVVFGGAHWLACASKFSLRTKVNNWQRLSTAYLVKPLHAEHQMHGELDGERHLALRWQSWKPAGWDCCCCCNACDFQILGSCQPACVFRTN
jgi:hypothetical protein